MISICKKTKNLQDIDNKLQRDHYEFQTINIQIKHGQMAWRCTRHKFQSLAKRHNRPPTPINNLVSDLLNPVLEKNLNIDCPCRIVQLPKLGHTARFSFVHRECN